MSASGPLVARWRTLERAPVEAGTLQRATVEVENAGSATWRTRGDDEGLFLAFHWLDDRGNAIVWDGTRTPLEREVAPGDALRQKLVLRGPIPPGHYRLAVDLVEEHRFWLAELGNAPYEEDVDVLPREAAAARRSRARAVRAGRWASSALSASARLPLAPSPARAQLRRRRPARLCARERRA